MGLTLFDISSAMLNMTSQNVSGGQGQGSGATGLGSQSFYSKLNQVLKTQQGGTASEGVLNSNARKGLAQAVAGLMGNKEGQTFVSELKNLMLSLSNGDLASMSVDQDGLSALKQLLSQAGFAEDEIAGLMEELSLTLEDGSELSMSTVMDRLEDLPTDEDPDDDLAPEALVPTSQIPYIQVLLQNLGVPDGDISRIISESSRGADGFSLDQAIDMLKSVEQNAFSSGISLETQDTTFQTTFQQLGLNLDSTSENSGTLTLAQLIRAMEQKQATLKEAALAVNGAGTLSANAGAVPTTQEFFQTLFSGVEETNATVSAGTSLMSSTQELFQKLFSGIDVSDDSSQTNSEVSKASVDGIGEKLKGKFVDQLGQNTETTDNAASPKAQIQETGKTTTVVTLSESGKEQGENPSSLKSHTPLSSASDTSQTGIDGEGGLTARNTFNVAVPKANQTVETLPRYVMQQVNKSIVKAVNLGEETLKIQLKPPELGRVFMTIDNHGDSMKVSIITDNHSAKELLASNVHEIRTMLSSSGISLEHFEVDMSSDFRQSMADARNQNQSGGRKKQNGSGAGAGEEDENAAVDISSLTAARGLNNGSLHYVA